MGRLSELDAVECRAAAAQRQRRGGKTTGGGGPVSILRRFVIEVVPFALLGLGLLLSAALAVCIIGGAWLVLERLLS